MSSKSKQFSGKDLLSITKSPGAQYIIANADSVIREINSGYADISSGVEVTESTTFNAFSITKTATAAALLKLSEQGKILLSDFVNPILNEFHFKYPFTVRHLLSHQAGLADPIPVSWIHLVEEEKLFNENDFIRRIVDKNSEQKFKPGDKFSYSNIGYLLLKLLIEKVSREQYVSYIRDNIIPSLSEGSKLGFAIEEKRNHATGYHPRFSFSNLILGFLLDRKKYINGSDGKWITFNNFYVNGKSYGGLIGNARGLSTYLKSFLTGSVFSNNPTLQDMFTEQKKGMTLSWFKGSLNGETYYCHAGGGGGYYCEIRIYPVKKISSVLLRNRSSFSDLRLLDKIDSTIIF
jgi:D-alanyl-D-alanine carboxypeptidase